jgi:hypothetical protein
VIPHPPYSLAFTSGDFFLFSKMRGIQKGKTLQKVLEIIQSGRQKLNIKKEDFVSARNSGIMFAFSQKQTSLKEINLINRYDLQVLHSFPTNVPQFYDQLLYVINNKGR